MQKSLIGKYILICLFAGFTVLFSQTAENLHKQNLQLDKIKQEITRLEKELQNKSRTERESLQTLENLNRQNLLLNNLINNLLAEENEKEIAIGLIQARIDSIENRIKNLKESYARYVVWVYKNRGLSMWRFVFNAESFNQAVQRYKYLQYVSDENAKTLGALKSNREQLNELRLRLVDEKETKQNLVDQKMTEQESLKQKEKEKKELLAVLKKDKKSIAAEISSKRRAEIVIKNLIAKLIETERARKAKSHENKMNMKKNVQDFDYSGFENFGQLKGRLSWPIKEGRVVRDFGENKNEKLNTVTLNYGIDIAVRGKESVRAVAEGIVSAINWIPGYGSVVIITHRDEYRTVYGHVANISVKEGERIKAGNAIGSVNESLEGNILHFEIWSERNYQNPDVWLARK
ncbi:MAG: peptidoglycan DD-metalloendopeptidase family protein [Bacteroidota bacterium]